MRINNPFTAERLSELLGCDGLAETSLDSSPTKRRRTAAINHCAWAARGRSHRCTVRVHRRCICSAVASTLAPLLQVSQHLCTISAAYRLYRNTIGGRYDHVRPGFPLLPMQMLHRKRFTGITRTCTFSPSVNGSQSVFSAQPQPIDFLPHSLQQGPHPTGHFFLPRVLRRYASIAPRIDLWVACVFIPMPRSLPDQGLFRTAPGFPNTQYGLLAAWIHPYKQPA